MSQKIISKSEFTTEVLNSDKPVLVDFFATWCGPCKMLAPVLDTVSEQVGSNAKVLKIDIDKEPELAQQFGIMSVPTMVVFKGGAEADRIVGLRSKDEIVAKIIG